jgi:hypothetical protein
MSGAVPQNLKDR